MDEISPDEYGGSRGARFSFENDADNVSGTLLGTEIKRQIAGCRQTINTTEQNAMRDMTAIAGKAVHTLFTKTRDSQIDMSMYPDPMARSIHVISTAFGELGPKYGDAALQHIILGMLSTELNSTIYTKNEFKTSERLPHENAAIEKSLQHIKENWSKYTPCPKLRAARII